MIRSIVLFVVLLGAPTICAAQDASRCETVARPHRAACVAVLRAIYADDVRALRRFVRSGDGLYVLNDGQVRGPDEMVEAIERAGGLRAIFGQRLIEISYIAPRRTRSRGPLAGEIVLGFENVQIRLAIEHGGVRLTGIGRRAEEPQPGLL